MDTYPKHIVFIDADCTMCNRAVLMLDKRDSEKVLHYASLSSDTAKRLLPSKLIESQKSFVYYSDGLIKVKSSALLSLIMLLETHPFFVAILKCTPTVISDLVYNCISTNRLRLSNRMKSCVFNQDLKNRVLN